MMDRVAVLVIDDEAAIRESLSDILEFNGYQAIAAEDGESGTALFKEHQHEVGLIILDLVMPGLSGPETLRRLRQIDPDVTILLSSGYDEDEIVQLLDNARIAQTSIHFLQKPYSLTSVVGITRSLLEKAKPR